MADKQAQISAMMLEGSAAYRKGYVPQAISIFSQAATLAPKNEMIFNARSLAYVRTSRFEEALADAEKVIELKRSWVKGYVRKGQALGGLGRHEEAMMTLLEGLDKDPKDPGVRKTIMECRKHLTGPMGGDRPLVNPFADLKLWEKIEKHPITRQYLNQADYRDRVQELQKDPKLLNKYMEDARIMTTVGVLMDVEIEAPVEASGGTGAQGPVHEVLPAAAGGFSHHTNLPRTGPTLTELDDIDEVVMPPRTRPTITELPDDEDEGSSPGEPKKTKKNRKNKSARKAAAAAAAAAANNAPTATDEPKMAAATVSEDTPGTADTKNSATAAEQKPTPQKETRPRTGNQLKALEEKNKGNAAYKQKQFEMAIEHYSKAIELDPINITFRTNRAAVYFEQGKYDECIKECESATEIGRENRADFKLIAKAFSRIGNAYHKKGDLQNAIKYYEKSVSEHRTPDVVRRISETKKEMKDKERLQYIDPEKSLEAKKLGNEAFTKGDYPSAIRHYDEAIKRNPDDAKLFSNRAACYTKLAEFSMAVKDADECIRLDPNFVKGYLRKAGCLLAMKDYNKAKATYQKAIELDHNCQEALDGFRRCSAEENDPEAVQQRVMNDPEIRKILQDPGMQTILSQMQQDTSAVREHLKNPEIAAKIQKLIDCGLIRMQAM